MKSFARAGPFRTSLLAAAIFGATDAFSAVISPGARYAFNLSAGQLVLGVAAPIGLNRAAPDYGVIFYLSFEHRFLKE